MSLDLIQQSCSDAEKADSCAAVHSAKKATIHQVTTMLGTSKHVLFPGHNHMLTTGADDLTL